MCVCIIYRLIVKTTTTRLNMNRPWLWFFSSSSQRITGLVSQKASLKQNFEQKKNTAFLFAKTIKLCCLIHYTQKLLQQHNSVTPVANDDECQETLGKRSATCTIVTVTKTFSQILNCKALTNNCGQKPQWRSFNKSLCQFDFFQCVQILHPHNIEMAQKGSQFETIHT